MPSFTDAVGMKVHGRRKNDTVELFEWHEGKETPGLRGQLLSKGLTVHTFDSKRHPNPSPSLETETTKKIPKLILRAGTSERKEESPTPTATTPPERTHAIKNAIKQLEVAHNTTIDYALLADADKASPRLLLCKISVQDFRDFFSCGTDGQGAAGQPDGVKRTLTMTSHETPYRVVGCVEAGEPRMTDEEELDLFLKRKRTAGQGEGFRVAVSFYDLAAAKEREREEERKRERKAEKKKRQLKARSDATSSVSEEKCSSSSTTSGETAGSDDVVEAMRKRQKEKAKEKKKSQKARRSEKKKEETSPLAAASARVTDNDANKSTTDATAAVMKLLRVGEPGSKYRLVGSVADMTVLEANDGTQTLHTPNGKVFDLSKVKERDTAVEVEKRGKWTRNNGKRSVCEHTEESSSEFSDVEEEEEEEEEGKGVSGSESMDVVYASTTEELEKAIANSKGQVWLVNKE